MLTKLEGRSFLRSEAVRLAQLPLSSTVVLMALTAAIHTFVCSAERMECLILLCVHRAS